jgi:hypothetical protein
MVLGAPSQGLKKPFTFEKKKNNVLKFETFYELKHLFNNCLVVVANELLVNCN